MPTVSVIIPSYNHGEYIAECIQSVLDQIYQDFEIIITDDGSTDNTADVIESIEDSRISLYKHPKNRGVSLAANNCICHASGKYIAWLSSDDAWYPEKLAVQVKYLDEHSNIAAVFGKVEWVDKSGITIDQFPYINIFNVANRTRYEWLRQFFVTGNCLSLPSSLVRAECFSDMGMFDPVFAGVLDLDLWVRVCLKQEIMIIDQKLIRNRWISDESNASGNTTENIIRNRFEFRHILDHYLRIDKPDELLLIFPDAIKYGKVEIDTIPYFLARIAISSEVDYKMLWGLDVIYRLLKDGKMARVLEKEYDFSYIEFIKLVRKCDSFRWTERPFFVEQVNMLNDQIAEKEKVVIALAEQIAGKDRALSALAEQVAEKDVRIGALLNQIDADEQILASIYASRSWRAIQLYQKIIQRLLPRGKRTD